MLLNAYAEGTTTRVQVGATVTDFRGDTATLERLERANERGRDGKVVVRYEDDEEGNPQRGYHYAKVWGLEVRSPEVLHIGTLRETCSSHGCPGCIR